MCRRREVFVYYTMIELLVVISMISILAALLLPILGNAKALSRSFQCKHQLRQLGESTHAWGTDLGTYPHCYIRYNYWKVSSDYTYWLSVYLGSKFKYCGYGDSADLKWEGFECPDSARAPIAPLRISSYSTNGRIFTNAYYSSRHDDYRKYGTVPRPSEVLLIGDGTENCWFGAYAEYYIWVSPDPALADTIAIVGHDTDPGNWSEGSAYNKAYVRYRHPGHTGNIIFADYHVESVVKGNLRYKNLTTEY